MMKNMTNTVTENGAGATCDGLIGTAFQAMLSNTSDMIFLKDENLVYVAASKPFVKMVGKHAVEDVIGKTDMELYADENIAKRHITDDRKFLAGGQRVVEYIEPLAAENGNARYGAISKQILSDANGKIIGILGVIRDITRDYIARQHYQRELKYLFVLPQDTYAVSYIDVDTWRIISQRRQQICEGTLEPSYTVDELCREALGAIVNKDSDVADFYRNFTATFLRDAYADAKNNLSFTYERRMSNGATRWVYSDLRFLTDVDSGHLCCMLTAKDIDAVKREEQSLVMSAQLDKMTMVLNRETTERKIRKILAEESKSVHVLFMVDVDNFKSLNDTMGHQAGDQFLISLAAELKKCFRETDVVGRIGGDEFFALMRNVSGLTGTERKAQQLLDAIQKVCADYPTVRLSGSIGVGLYPEHGDNFEDLYAKADAALYTAKHRGKNQYVFASVE